MTTEILKSFGTLQHELEQAKSSLKGVDENIKRLIGRDPSELSTQTKDNRNNTNKQQQRPLNSINNNTEQQPPPAKRQRISSVFKRLSDRPIHTHSHHHHHNFDAPGSEDGGRGDLHHHHHHHQHYQHASNPLPRQMISKVIVTPKEPPSRQEALAAQSRDERSNARNRRMFGALLGTLQKFQQEETRLKPKEEKRALLERKIEEHEIKEKEEIKKERQELFSCRKRKQAEIKMIELKMVRMREYAAWEERQKPRMNFILTKATPPIQYLPRKLSDANRALLENCRSEVERMIENKKQKVHEELQLIEERMTRNYESRRNNNPNNNNNNNNNGNQKRGENDENNSDNEEDEEMREELSNEEENDEKNPQNIDAKQVENNEENVNKETQLEEKEEKQDEEGDVKKEQNAFDLNQVTKTNKQPEGDGNETNVSETIENTNDQ